MTHKLPSDMDGNAYPLKPIQTETDYRAALQLVAPYFEHEPEIDSEAGKHFEAMIALIRVYEAKHYPVDHDVPTAESSRSNH